MNTSADGTRSYSPAILLDFKSTAEGVQLVGAEMDAEFLQHVPELLLADKARTEHVQAEELLPQVIPHVVNLKQGDEVRVN